MKIEEIKALMDHMAASGLNSLVYRDGQTTLKLTKTAAPVASAAKPTPAVQQPTVAPKKTLKAPLVGIFYASATPDDEPFVKAGTTVKVGQTIGIIEAMKMMHEVKADQAGTITQVLVGNEQRVGFDDPLFELD
ncbi:acetyl-CoA carboxylase biotin carboxyl carrier protein [Loigolactobacillus binensis]|uniref:Biotin carboxyl carrier protein of acetyl-CoA carboxylase n=1 Tax=Loigolactobacillus binensis TaxID=2559922 RepID=A0ABW3EH79_9LACO|nr:biotin/lipoyl-containing protein [Loigolactobacillus binensis]